MEKRLYGKPLMSMEQFTPSEYVTGCWYVESGMCYDYLIHDRGGRYGQGDPDNYYNPQGNDVVLAQGHGTKHPLPNNNTYFKDEEKPDNINNGNYYDYPNGYNYIIRTRYHAQVTSDIFKVTYDGKDHYVKKITDAGNHS